MTSKKELLKRIENLEKELHNIKMSNFPFEEKLMQQISELLHFWIEYLKKFLSENSINLDEYFDKKPF